MRQIDLREYESRAIPLSGAELAALQEYRQELGLDIAPGTASGSWVLKPGSTVGALEIGDLLEVVIRPKLQIGRVLFLASYALGAFRLRDIERFHFAEDSSAVEALARFFAAASRRAFRRGLLRGYRSREEALTTVRGRIRFDEQIRRRFAIPLPVEVRYDEFTEDVRGNRLVRAALHRLHAMHIADMGLRGELLRTEAVLAEVTLREYAAHAVPEVAFDRLNEHYREVLGLARLILRHGTVKTDHGTIRAAGFLMDMNQVFERFVRRALREQLALTRRAFPAPDDMPRLFLDQDRKIRL